MDNQFSVVNTDEHQFDDAFDRTILSILDIDEGDWLEHPLIVDNEGQQIPFQIRRTVGGTVSAVLFSTNDYETREVVYRIESVLVTTAMQIEGI